MQLPLMGRVLPAMPSLKVRDGPRDIHHKMKVEIWQWGSAELEEQCGREAAVLISMPPTVLTLVAQSQLIPLTPWKSL